MAVALPMGVAVGAYLLAVARTPRRWPVGRTVAWLGGCTAIVAALLVDEHGDPRVHMAQHVVIGMVAPVGLVLGAPVTLLLAASSTRVRRTVVGLLRSRPVHILGHPIVAAGLSTGALYLVLLTPLYAFTVRNDVVHQALHLHYLAAGYLFAWAIAGPDPAPRRPGLGTRLAVLVAASAAHAFLAKSLYANAGTFPPTAGLDAQAVEDAARVMYYGGDAAGLLLATVLFATWYRRRRLIVDEPWRAHN